MLQTSSFAQLRSDLTTRAQSRVATYLQSRATKLNSRVLAAVADRASSDPFNKVKNRVLRPCLYHVFQKSWRIDIFEKLAPGLFNIV
jgi:hypothetical protein